jgi:hypothetical protein
MPKYLVYMFVLTFHLKCVLFGILLSDGCLSMGVNFARLVFIQAIPALGEYFWFVLFLFIPFCNVKQHPHLILDGVLIALA